jgi:hypothetical protein
LRTGTWANRPAASAAAIGSVRTLPSTTPGIPTKSGGHQVRDRQVAQAGRGLVRAAHLGRECLAGGLGVSQRLLVERERPAFDDRPLEQPARAGRDQLGEHRQAAG